MDEQTIVVLGAGFSGVFTTLQLAERVADDSRVKIQLINKDPHFTYKTRLHEVLSGRILPKEALHDLDQLFKGYPNVEIIVDEVKQIKEKEQLVINQSSQLSYDYLVLAMGSEPNDFGIEGVKEYGFTMWSWKEAVRIRKQILSMVENAATIEDPAKRAAMLHFVVCGGGLTGIEIIGELIEWKPQLEEAFGLKENEISLTLVEATSAILPALSEKEGKRVKNYLKENHVELMTEAAVSRVTMDTVAIEDQASLQTHTLIWAAGVKANTDSEQVAGVFGKAKRLKTSGTMAAEGLEKIYVVGDLVHYEDQSGELLPQNTQTAEQTATTAAENIAARIHLENSPTQHRNNQKGSIVSVGAGYGVGYLMDKVHLNGPIAVTMKHVVNLATLTKLTSTKGSGRYLKQEIQAAKQKRYLS